VVTGSQLLQVITAAAAERDQQQQPLSVSASQVDVPLDAG